MQNQMRLCQRSPSYLYKLTTLQLNLKHRIHSKIGQHQNILYRSQKKTLAMKLCGYYIYNQSYKLITLTIVIITSNLHSICSTKRQKMVNVHYTIHSLISRKQKVFLDPLNWVLQLCWLTQHNLAIKSLQYFLLSKHPKCIKDVRYMYIDLEFQERNNKQSS